MVKKTMTRHGIPKDTITDPHELPVFLEGTRGEGVLLLHGYTAGPGEVRYLGEQLHAAGFTVSIPRLPGHGTRKEDLLSTTAHDWLRRCVDAYLDLAGRCGTVHIVGFSLGGILAAILAARLSPARLVLIAPGILNRNRLILFAPLLAAVVAPFVPCFRRPVPARSGVPGFEHLEEEYWRWTFIRPINDIFILQRIARRSLRNIACPTLVAVSRGDRVIPEKTAAYVANRIGTGDVVTKIYDRFPHRMVMEEGKEEIAVLVTNFLRRLPCND